MSNIIEWITTIPGILIGSGVLLLIVALVIFIITSRPKKEKEEGNLETFNINNTTPNQPVNPIPTSFGINNNNKNQNLNRPFENKPQMEESIKPLGIDNTIVMNPISNMNNNINDIPNTNIGNNNMNNFSNANISNDNMNSGLNNVNNPTINNYQTPIMPNQNQMVNETVQPISNPIPTPIEIKPVVEVTPAVPVTPIAETPNFAPVREVVPAVEVTPVTEAIEPNLSDIPGETFVKAPEKEEIETLDF